jgi:hypothetical protein
VVHLLQVDGAALGSLLVAAMALACLPCAWHLWRSPTPGVWAMTAALDVGMLLVHAQMLSGAQTMPGMAHGTGSSPLVAVGLAVVATQLVLAAAAGLVRLRIPARD